MTDRTTGTPHRPSMLLALLGVFFVGLNLRAAITSVAFVLPQIRSDFTLGATAAGLLTTVPLLAFVCFSMQVPRWGRRFGTGRLILFSMILLGIGFAIRLVPVAAVLFLGMAVIGLAIAIGNVLLPAYIKSRYPDRAGPLMGIYTVSLYLGPALAAAGTLPIARATGSWQVALLSWAILLLVAVPLWLPHLRGVPAKTSAGVSPPTAALSKLWSNPLAWSVTIYFAVLSVLFYTVNGWLPTMLQDRGSSGDLGGNVLTVVNFAAIPFALVVSILVARTHTQVWATLSGSLFLGIGLAGILFAPESTWVVWAICFGIGHGTATGVGFSLAMLRTRTAEGTAALGAMSQTAGYTMSALGPVGAGALRDLTGGWDVVIWVIIGIVAVQAVAGVFAGRSVYVDDAVN
ncbi:CynX/NimT family MFS transporter [Corynebacterium sp. A21]|uniref:CynX/NimT family MFS transporter n=1 Tax=Corynebacterium sp. A21 TaxID=3457318 RepID=UPI003FD58E16